jgi:O-6-methylguanine DNA methyltransferase
MPQHIPFHNTTKSLQREKVYSLLMQIPCGFVTTYGEIARALDSRAYRAVGMILNQNPDAPRVPCHRVVMSDGSLGGYAFGVERKRELLLKEGVSVDKDTVVNFHQKLHRFTHPVR